MGDSDSGSVGQVLRAPDRSIQHQPVLMVKMETIAPPSENSSIFQKKDPDKI